jgi:hypothetical protein
LFDSTSLKTDVLPRLGYGLFWLALFVASLGAGRNAYANDFCLDKQTITAKVVVLDNPTVFNRLGAQNPNWITYSLRRDVVQRANILQCDASAVNPLLVDPFQAFGTCGNFVLDVAEQICVLDTNPDVTVNPADFGGVCPTAAEAGILAEVVGPNAGKPEAAGGVLLPGNVEQRPDKRPRPLVVRSVAGACLTVEFTNLLAKQANPRNVQQGPQKDQPGALFNDDQVAGRCAGFHATGTELANSIEDDGSMVGANPGANTGDSTNGPSEAVCGPGLAEPGGDEIYTLYTPHEGAFVINSYGAMLGSEQSGGNLGIGMFGALNVEPPQSRIYRSQVTEEELRLATEGTTASGHPVINYNATYPNTPPWSDEGKGGLPILNMLTPSGELVHSDINAIIAGPDADGSWSSLCPGADCPYPLESVGKNNPQLPNRIEAFREFTSVFHDEQTNSQVFPEWYKDPVLGYTLDGVGDAFMINYGSGGIGSEIIANRLHTGPMHDCTDCAYEEFFLASQTVGDPGLLVNMPANTGIEACSPRNILSPDCWRQFEDVDNVNGGYRIGANPPLNFPGPDGLFGTADDVNNYALYQEDPSNVHHSYVGDHTKIRNTHAGAFEQHIFHLHNHQWLFNPNDDNANYLDAQEIMPGSGHTYELVNGGVGNRNRTSGDAIFHCHFYPHFAQGMWYHIRIMDVFERGTVLAASGAVQDPQNPILVGDERLAGEDGILGDDPDTLDKDEGADDLVPDPFHTSAWALRRGQPAAGARALPDGELPDGVPIPAIVPLPGKAMPPMPAKVTVAAVDRGDFGVLSGRRPPGGLGQGPDSSQAIVDLDSVKGPNNILGDDDDVSPGYPFWLAGNSCGFVDNGDGTFGNATAANCPDGTVGQRMPTPVLDMLTEEGAAALRVEDPDLFANVREKQAGGWDGGLPRHNLRGYTSGGLSLDTQSRLDFRKIIKAAQPVYYPETGTPLERVSMRHHARNHGNMPAIDLNGTVDTTATFMTNGSKPVPGGPFQDPCVDDKQQWAASGANLNWFDGEGGKTNGKTVVGSSPYGADNPRTYRIANLQIDAVFNKVGHHYAQERIIALWGDVEALVNKQMPPEPLVMRFNTFDCGRILHSNLVPAEFELDDFQVRTPTDIIGQHIHLPKWDLTTGDGAANGWNYEDGALSPLMVQERIDAINAYNSIAGTSKSLTEILTVDLGLSADNFQADLLGAIANHQVNLGDLEPVYPIDTGDPGSSLTPAQIAGTEPLLAQPHPFFGKGQYVNGHFEYEGARTVIQRILVDPVVNVQGVDRGLGLTFSHDHYGPSTFQQIGLYSTILAEPASSTWVHNETGDPLWGREIALPLENEPGGCTDNCTDGGPTSWQAAILTNTDPLYIDSVGGKLIKEHREFYFEMSDFQHAYEAGTYVGAGPDGRPLNAEFGGLKDPAACAADPDAAGACDREKGADGGKLIPQIHFVRNDTYFDAVRKGGPNSNAVDTNTLGDTWQRAVNPTLKLEAALMDIVTAEGACPGNLTNANAPTNADVKVPRPCSEAINLGHSSTWVINYRNEPIGLRVYNPDGVGPDGNLGAQTGGRAGDLAFAMQSRTDRAIPELNTSFGKMPYPNMGNCDGINCDRGSGDPITPIMRAYERDEVKIKIQVGATEEQHQSTVHGIKWLSNGSAFGRSGNSGWRNFQSHGISEQFSLQMPFNPDLQQTGQRADYLYATDATRPGMWLGTWGILRSYNTKQNDLYELPSNPARPTNFVNADGFVGVCPAETVGRGNNKRILNLVEYKVAAVLANDVLPNNLGVVIPSNEPGITGPGGDSDLDGTGDNAGGPLNPDGGTLVYNRREVTVLPDAARGLPGGSGPLHDPTAMMYVMVDDLEVIDPEHPGCAGRDPVTGSVVGNFDPDNPDAFVSPAVLATCPVKLADDAPVEPLVLRAEAGDCIEVTLYNRLAQAPVDDDGGAICHMKEDGTYERQFYESAEASYKCDGDGYDWWDHDGDGIPMAANAPQFDLAPDLAGWQDMMWGVTRRLQGAGPTAEMYFFNNNQVRPSSAAGLHAQLVEYDVTRDDGVIVGRTDEEGSNQVAPPGGVTTYRWYAGDLQYNAVEAGRNNNKSWDVEIVATPVEFGAVNLLSSDRVKQPQKSLFGALVIEPKDDARTIAEIVAEDTVVPDGQMACMTRDAETGNCTEVDPAGTRRTRAQVTVNAPVPAINPAGSGGTYREALAMGHKIANLRWADDGSAIKNLHQGELGREGAEDSGHAGFNYGMEPSWYRFGLNPDAPFGNAGAPNSFGSIPNQQAFYANKLVELETNAIPENPAGCSTDDTVDCISRLGDPQTPVLRTTAGMPTRMHVLNGASADRDGTFVLHGHLWQRDPYVCPGERDLDLEGKCLITNPVPSRALGLNPVGKYMGSEEGMGHVYGYWPILFNAGGTAQVDGDYLFRDYSPSGNRNGMFGILRVDAPTTPTTPTEEPKPDNPNKGGKKK